MKDALLRLKEKIIGHSEKDFDYPDEFGEDYLEISSEEIPERKAEKILVKPFVLNEFADVKAPLTALRKGNTVVLLDISKLRSADNIEIKRTVNQIKKTCQAIGGDIVGFGENWIIATSSCAKISRD